jgi:hypothetical protein
MELINITDWASPEIKTITVSQIYVKAPYNVQVRKFIPAEGDMLDLTWASGPYVRRHRMPQYALADMEGAAETLQWLTSNYVGRYIKDTVGELDLLIWTTYFFAFRYQAKAKVSAVLPPGLCNPCLVSGAAPTRKGPDCGLPEILGWLP